MPATVEDTIADIATVFHWSPNVFDEMELDELMQWRGKPVNGQNIKNKVRCKIYENFTAL
ncbi:hypothetical protein C3Z13_11150 [Avibacterium endocarditidis]|uniref:GpE family phage tail protein n=1 Tax=Avibacterium endocarditidis TaxID=380674 RepID=A0ABX4ZQ29_9PAST|nr:hypothetical protein C3Z13_11150 [Avibacterium endocarditidis]